MRENWSSRLTYILTVAGATIGFGATWRFPYLVGQNGGGAYLFTFIIVMFVLGVPLLMAESTIGRRMQASSLDAFGGKVGNKPVSKFWKVLGYTGLLGAFGIMSYYMVLGGWVITYIVNVVTGKLNLSAPISNATTEVFFDKNINNNTMMIMLYTFIFALMNYYILVKGIIKGIESTMKYLMPLLFCILIIMVIRGVTLAGASKGISFYLTPDFSKITPQLIIFVMGQVFFALSIGFGVLITLASYLNKKENMIQTAVMTGVVNTIIAFLAGFIIFPSLFAFGLDPASGPGLVFKVLPIVFSNMWAGNFFAILFFSLLLIAALTSAITIYEVFITAMQEKLKFSRKKATFITIFSIFILGNIPSILSYGEWSHIKIMGMNIFDAFDYFSGNIFFILTGLGSAIFVGWVLKDEAIREITNDYTIKFPLQRVWLNYLKFVVPIFIIGVFITSL